jgi:signal transduction histidine kinase
MLARLLPKSLSGRLLLVSTSIAIVASLMIVVFLGATYRLNEERAFRSLLEAHLLSLIAQTRIGSDQSIVATSDSGFPEFSRPLSGWYWQVVDGQDGDVFSSASLAGAALPFGEELGTLNDDFERFYIAPIGPSEQNLVALETSIFLGDSSRPSKFLVTGPAQAVASRVNDFLFWLAGSVAAFALLLIAANLLAVRFGLRPLREIEKQVVDISQSKRENIAGDVPNEVEPLVAATNDLIQNNRKLVEKAQAQVGNLAHALKTPIAVLRNEAGRGKAVRPELVSEQAESMLVSVQRYLDRARIAANRGNLVQRVDVVPLAQRLARVMRKLHPEIDISVSTELGEIHFSGDGQDFEEAFGNLLENAIGFANSSVVSRIRLENGFMVLIVEDDGPGLTDEQIETAIQRGKRLDETRAGSGLGLSIVGDIAEEYEGRFELGRSDLGGLRATLHLPAPSA